MLLALLLAPAPGGRGEPVQLDGIIGEDGRVRIRRMAPPWTAIGRLNRRFGGFCTGALVAADLVLTAAHCLYNVRAGRWPAPPTFHFVAGYSRGRHAADAPGIAVRSAGIALLDGNLPDHIGSDWVYLRLARPLAGSGGIAPFPLYRGPLAPMVGRPLMLAGYHQDAAHILSVERGCSIVEVFGGGRTFMHSCDSTRGASGAPLLLEVEGRLEIVGITVAVGRREGRFFGIGVRPPPP